MADADRNDLRSRIDRVRKSRNRKTNPTKLVTTFVMLAIAGLVVYLVVWVL